MPGCYVAVCQRCNAQATDDVSMMSLCAQKTGCEVKFQKFSFRFSVRAVHLTRVSLKDGPDETELHPTTAYRPTNYPPRMSRFNNLLFTLIKQLKVTGQQRQTQRITLTILTRTFQINPSVNYRSVVNLLWRLFPERLLIQLGPQDSWQCRQIG